jgi:N utilization substance protein B
MTRKEARNQAFILIFEKIFSESDIAEIIETAKECRNFEEDGDGYTVKAFTGVYENLEEIDELIAKNLSGWTIERISKVSLAVLRLAIYEIKYMDEIPTAVSIDEAVELCKKYSTVDDASFVNGVLGSVVRAM